MPPNFENSRISLPKSHPDFLVIKGIEEELFKRAKKKRLEINKNLPELFRQALDEVIDTPRTFRFTLQEIEKTEKTYIGTKIEILLRNFFDIPKGVLDLRINGRDVDIKNTVTGNWMIPPEAFGKPCLLVHCNEEKNFCSFGIFIAHQKYLTKPNRDKKCSVSKEGKENIHWIFFRKEMPLNLWTGFSPEVFKRIARGKSGNERIADLFRRYQEKPIPREVVKAIARQRDFMKRVRKNGGARDILTKEGIFIFSGAYDASIIKLFGLPNCNRDEFISFTPKTNQQKETLRDKGFF